MSEPDYFPPGTCECPFHDCEWEYEYPFTFCSRCIAAFHWRAAKRGAGPQFEPVPLWPEGDPGQPGDR